MTDVAEFVSGFMSELRRSALVLAVLGILQTAEYGYNLLARLGEVGIEIEPDTLYPLLRRLEGQGVIVGEWNTDFAKPRKYYTRTALGNQLCGKYYDCWQNMVQSINLIKGDNNYEKGSD